MLRCPRCRTGYLLTRSYSLDKSDTETCCLTCGYEVRDIPQDVLDEVAKAYGKSKLNLSPLPRPPMLDKMDSI